MGGRGCIQGMRTPVSVIVGQIAHGASFEEILEGHPDLEREDVREALRLRPKSSGANTICSGHKICYC